MKLAKRAAIAAGTIGLAVGGFATAASAHVTIDTLGDVEQGSFAKLGVSVPNERDDASTIKVEVQMPTDHPLVFVSVQPKAGWEVETTTRTLETPVEAFGATFDTAVDAVTWTATGDTKIGPGQFEQFWISAGAMPTDVDVLEFPAVQTYDSGEIVRWIEPTPEGGEEPEHPAPVVALVAAGHDAATEEGAAEEDAAITETAADGASDGAATSTSTDDDGTDALTIVALIAGVGGLGLGGAALVSSRRKATPA